MYRETEKKKKLISEKRKNIEQKPFTNYSA